MSNSSRGDFRHLVHGLLLLSNYPLPLFPPVASTADPVLEVWQGPLAELQQRCQDVDWPAIEAPARPWPNAQLQRHTTAAGEIIVCRMAEAERLLVALIAADGSSIQVGWRNPDARIGVPPEEFVARYLLSKWLALALRLSGRLVLHGNAVLVEGRVLAWIGDKGAGKSTLAAAFVAAGYPLLADDQLLLWPQADAIAIAAGVRRLHLWPSSVETLAPVAEANPLQQPFGTPLKGYVYCADDARLGDPATPKPLAQLYLLQPRHQHPSGPLRQTLAPAARLHALWQHSLGRDELALSPAQQAAEFQALGALLPKLPVQSLCLPDNLAALPTIVRQLCADV